MSPATVVRLTGRRLIHYSLLAAVIVAGAALRIYDLGAESYWTDEVVMVELARGDAQTLFADFWYNGRPPVYVWLARGWMAVFGTTESATRGLSAIFGIASVLMMYLVGQELFSRGVGLISAVFLAFSTVQIDHAQFFRYYSLMVLLTLVSFFFYHRATRLGRPRDFAYWAVTSVLLFHTHDFAIFCLAAQTLHSLVAFRERHHLLAYWGVSQLAIYIAPAVRLIAPFTRTVVTGGPVPGPVWIPEAGLWTLYTTVQRFIFTGVSIRWLLIAVCTFVLGGLVLNWVRHGWTTVRLLLRESTQAIPTETPWRDLLLVTLWFAVPLITPFVLSLVLRPMFVPRYVLGAAPALYLLVACGIWSFRRLLSPAVGLGLFGALAAPGLHHYYTTSDHQQWREAAAHVTAASRAGDAILLGRYREPPIFGPDPHDRSWAWYYKGDLARCDRAEPITAAHALADSLRRCLTEHRRTWVVLPETAFPDQLLEELSDEAARQGAENVELLQEQRFHRIRVYLVARAPLARIDR